MTTEPQSSLTKKDDIAVLGGFILTLCFAWFLWQYRINIGHRLIWSSVLSLSFPFFYLIFAYHYLVSRTSARLPLLFGKKYRQASDMKLSLACLCFVFLLLLLGGVVSSFFSNQFSFDKTIFIRKDSQQAKQIFSMEAGSYPELLEKIESKDKRVILFYKLACRKCQRAVPELLAQVQDQDKLLFIDISSEAGGQAAQRYGVDQAATAMVWGDRGYKLYSLATKEDDERITLNQAELDYVVQILNIDNK